MFTAIWARRHARERLDLEADEMAGGHYVVLSRPRELAERLDISREEVIEVLQAHLAASPSSLDAQPPEDDRPGRTLVTAIGDVDPGLGLVEDRMAVVPLLAELPERERRILQLRFFHDMTQTEIAALTGISQMHVSRLLARTLGTLRSRLAEA